MLPFMTAMMVAPAGVATPTAMTFAGSLAATGSTATITSTARAVTVPGGNPGMIRIDYTDLGDGATLQCRKNSDAPVVVSSGDVFTFANTDTITLSALACLSSGDGVSVSLFDVAAGSLIQSASLFRV